MSATTIDDKKPPVRPDYYLDINTRSPLSHTSMLTNAPYDLLLRSLGLTTTFLNGSCSQMASKPKPRPDGSEVRRGLMKTVMSPSRQSHRRRPDNPQPLPPDLQKLVNKAEEDRVVYEDPWTRTRPSDKFDEQPRDHAKAEPSEPLPEKLQELVDKEEADRVLYEDSWTRTRPSDKFLEGSMLASATSGKSPGS